MEIKDTESGEWIAKQDVGTVGYAEKEKSQASDSFKRACFNWGIGQDFFILPSSIHETILVPAGETDAAPRELAAMVSQVNGTEVSEEEFLSGHVYHYCAAGGRITIAA